MLLINRIKQLYLRFIYFLLQRTDSNGVTYLWKRKGTKKLVIVFSGIGPAGFNYVRTFKDINIDQLFIKDSWAKGVSYYWYEKKNSYPEKATQNLINRILKESDYSTVYTIGSSKGGTAALYYGFMNNVDYIIVGACQYKVGSYLSDHQYKNHPEQWKEMIGGVPCQDWISILDNKVAKMIKKSKSSKTEVRLLYSTEEHTYGEHIVPLIDQLNKYGIVHKDQIETFPQHSMIGYYFRNYLRKFFKNTNE